MTRTRKTWPGRTHHSGATVPGSPPPSESWWKTLSFPSGALPLPGGLFLSGTLLLAGVLVLSGCNDQPVHEESSTVAATPAPVVEEEPVPTAGGKGQEADAEPVLTPASEDRSVAERLRDASLAAKVQWALAGTRGLRAYRFTPEVSGGHLTLQGHVEYLAQRQRAESIASAVEGILSVSNEITSTERPRLAQAEQDDAATQGSTPNASSHGGAAAQSPNASAADGASTQWHTVRQGETLWSIARRYRVSVNHVKQLNGLRSDAIKIGTRLKIR